MTYEYDPSIHCTYTGKSSHCQALPQTSKCGKPSTVPTLPIDYCPDSDSMRPNRPFDRHLTCHLHVQWHHPHPRTRSALDHHRVVEESRPTVHHLTCLEAPQPAITKSRAIFDFGSNGGSNWHWSWARQHCSASAMTGRSASWDYS